MARIISFDGMERHRGITPTDVDAIIDYHGNALVIIECKYQGNKVPVGQRIALQRLARQPNSFVIVCEHTNQTGDIILKNCKVTETFFEQKWHDERDGVSVIAIIERFENYLKGKGVQL